MTSEMDNNYAPQLISGNHIPQSSNEYYGDENAQNRVVFTYRRYKNIFAVSQIKYLF